MASKSLTYELFGVDKSASKAIAGVGTQMGLTAGQMKTGAFVIGAALGAATVAAVTFSVDSIKAFAEAEQAQNRLAFAYEKFPSLATANIESIKKLNTELQKKTRFDDDALAAAEGTLAQYDLSGEQLEKLIPLLADYAAATGKDAGEAAEDLGKAILGQGRALKNVGIDFEDAGDPLSNYTALVDGLSEKVGGFAEKDAQTVSGKLDMLENQFGEIQEKLGAAFKPGLDLAAELIGETLLPKLDEVIDRVGPKLQAGFEEIAPKLQIAVDDALPILEEFANKIPDLIGAASDSFSADFGRGNNGVFDPAVWEGFARFGEEAEAWRKSMTLGYLEITEAGLVWMDASTHQVWMVEKANQTASAAIKGYWTTSIDETVLALWAKGVEWVGIGQHYGDGLAEGFHNRRTTVREAAALLANEAIFTTRNVMGIESPSKVAKELGGYWSEGFAMGIEDDLWRVDAAANQMGLSALPSGTGGSMAGAVGGAGVQITVNGYVGNESQLAKVIDRTLSNGRKVGAIA